MLRYTSPGPLAQAVTLRAFGAEANLANQFFSIDNRQLEVSQEGPLGPLFKVRQLFGVRRLDTALDCFVSLRVISWFVLFNRQSPIGNRQCYVALFFRHRQMFQ